MLAVTQQELALMIGVSRQTTNQILKELEARGILRVQRGCVEVLKLVELKRVSE